MLASVVWCLCTANLADGDFENVLRRIFSINLTITTVFVMRINCKQEPGNAQSRRAKSPAFDQRAAPKNHRNAIAGLRKTVYRNGSPILSRLANNADVTRRASDRPTD